MSVVGKSEPNVTGPGVYGNTPFQHEVTTEPTNASVVVFRPVTAIGYWQRTVSTVGGTPVCTDQTIAARSNS